MHVNIPNMFDCWADPVLHLLRLNCSMFRPKVFTAEVIGLSTNLVLVDRGEDEEQLDEAGAKG